MGWSGTTANGAKFFLDMQLVADTDTTQTVRTVIYLTSPNVSDTNNNCSVGGDGYSRSGTLGLGGVYNHVPVWSQDVSHGKLRGANRTISTNCTWSGVDYWGATLSAVAGWTIGPAITEPDAGTCTAFAASSTSLTAYISAAGSENGATAIECEYHLYVNGPAGGGGTHVGTIGGFGANVGYGGGTFTGLTPGATYYAYGRTRNRVGWSAWDVSDAVVLPANPPTLTDAYYATNITRDSMQIVNYVVANNGGNPPNNARVQYNTTPSETGAQVKTAGSWSHVTLTGLTDLTTYYFRVAAANSSGWGPYPATWKSATTLDDAPNSVATPTFSGVGDTGFTANWTPPAMNGATFSSYRYELSLTSTFSSLVRSGTTTLTSVLFEGLTPGTNYHFRVRANATPANGGYGTAVQKTTGIAPNSGLRVYANVPSVGMRQGTLYANVGGVIRELRPMVNLGGTIQTE